MLRRRTSQPVSMLARWIVERRVVSFGWQGEYLLPMFQFDRAEMTVRRHVSAVLDEFDGTFDDWDLATWFALPNAWLGDDTPVDVLSLNPHARAAGGSGRPLHRAGLTKSSFVRSFNPMHAASCSQLAKEPR